MKVLVAWDDANEAELLPLYLGAGEHVTVMTSSVAEALAQVQQGPWDVVLFSLALPNAEGGFTLFRRLKEMLPGVPLMLACRANEMLSLPRFLINGLRFYLVRDAGG